MSSMLKVSSGLSWNVPRCVVVSAAQHILHDKPLLPVCSSINHLAKIFSYQMFALSAASFPLASAVSSAPAFPTRIRQGALLLAHFADVRILAGLRIWRSPRYDGAWLG
jgi:hypothetical protein